LMASQKVHLLRYALLSSLQRRIGLRFIPQDSQALHLELLCFAIEIKKICEGINFI